MNQIHKHIKEVFVNEIIINQYMQDFDLSFEYIDKFIDIKKILSFENKKSIIENGYCISKDAIDTELVVSIRKFWIEMSETLTINSNILIGEENYSKNFFGKYTRHFDFYWNEPRHKISRDLSLVLHMIRNALVNVSPYYGLTFNKDKIAVYQAITHYPLGQGEMTVHVDPNYFLNIHFNLPLTSYGTDYSCGGLYIINNDKKINIDELMSTGDILFFNGSVPHGIERITGRGSVTGLGRMQLFSIPTIMNEGRRSIFREVTFEMYGRLKYLLQSKGFLLNKDYKNFR